MRKTSVYLTSDEAEGLRRLAVREGRAQAELIREGIRRVIADGGQQPRSFKSLGSGASGGGKPRRWTSDELYAKARGTSSMALIVDAGALYAQADVDDPGHAAVRAVLVAEREELVTTELAVAEADYLILDRLGPDAEAAFLDDLVDGTFVVECLDRGQLGQAKALIAQYRDLRIGLADASLVVVAERYGARRLLSFDERAFRTVAPLQGGTFTLLPADS